jgi:pseudaminic acid synthase
MTTDFRIQGRRIGPGHPVYVVAELSGNHNQNFERAVQLVYAAKQAGADAVKMQTYTPDTITIAGDRECFHIGGGTLWDGRTLYDLYAEAHTPWHWQPKLKQFAEELGLHCFSSPFDATAVDFLEKMNVPAYKLASCELVDLQLIEKIARTGKPLIMSTGMATLEEIEEALATARNAGSTQIALLKCTSAYPAPWEEINLRTIPELAQRFSTLVGLSDHTKGLAVPIAAVALEACIIEKHLTLSRSHAGPDAEFSLEPHEFEELVHAIRAAQTALGSVQFGPTPHEESSRRFRRSLFVLQDMERGDLFSEHNVRSIRPSQGLHTRHLPHILGKRAARPIARGTPLSWDLIAADEMAEHDYDRRGEETATTVSSK